MCVTAQRDDDDGGYLIWLQGVAPSETEKGRSVVRRHVHLLNSLLLRLDVIVFVEPESRAGTRSVFISRVRLGV